MLERIKQMIAMSTLDDFYLVGFIEIDEHGVAEFSPMMRFLYAEFGEQYLAFESIEQYSKLRITICESPQYPFELDEEILPCKCSIRELVLTDTIADNRIVNLLFFGLEIQKDHLQCDALRIQLHNGQQIFLDPSFYFGINFGGNELERRWKENRISGIIPEETFITIPEQYQ